MIPVTSFAGKTVAVFGLGGSGLASCHALKAGGAEVIAGDDGADKLAEAAQAGFITADLRKVSWANFAALVLTPGAPLTHPAPHWTVLAAREAGVEVIGDIELFCRERRRHAPDAPFVAITGTNGKSTTTALIAHLMRVAGYDTQMGGNIGTAILSLEPPRMGRVHVIEMSSYQIDLSPSLDPSVGILLNVSEDHIDRHGTLEHYAAVKERLVAGVQKHGTAIVGVDDGLSRNTADRHRAGRPARGPGLGEKSAARRRLCRARNHLARLRRRAQRDRADRRHRLAARPAQRAECGLRRGLRAGARRLRRSPAKRPAQLSRARAPHGAGRPPRQRAVRQQLQGHQCGCGGACAVVLCRYLLDRRRQAEARRHHRPDRIFSAHPQGLSDRGGRAGICRHARRAACRTRSAETLEVAVANAARDAEASGLRRSGGAAVAGLRVVRPVPQFRNPRRRRSATSSPRCPASSRWCETTSRPSSPAKRAIPVSRVLRSSAAADVLDTRFRGA